jgi:hypothetical protein
MHGGGSGKYGEKIPLVGPLRDFFWKHGWDCLSWNLLEVWETETTPEFRAARETFWIGIFSVAPLANKYLTVKVANRRRKTAKL